MHARRMHHPRRLGAVLALLCTLVALLGAPQALAQSNHMKAQLLAEQPARPGETITLALHFTPEPGWHGYWLNPGDAGYGMDLKWDLPAGWQAGTPEYPVPQQLVIGGLMNHVYEGDYAVLVPLTIPAGADVSGAPPLGLAADMLVCTDQICVPEKKELSLDLSQVSQRDVRFDAWRAAIPPRSTGRRHFELTPDSLRIAIPLPASLALGTPHVFLDQTQLIDYAAPQSFHARRRHAGGRNPAQGRSPKIPPPSRASSSSVRTGRACASPLRRALCRPAVPRWQAAMRAPGSARCGGCSARRCSAG